MQLTWVIAPPSVPMPEDPDSLQQPVTLEVTMGSAIRKVELAPKFGSFRPSEQSVCTSATSPLPPGTVSEIAFYEGGSVGYRVKRPDRGQLVILAWSQVDGVCPSSSGLAPCPASEKPPISTLQIPPGVKVSEAIVEVDGNGVRHPFDCAPPGA
jgi:hypothetical protein